jgi:DNA-binding HxlR family transcriptional regulator
MVTDGYQITGRYEDFVVSLRLPNHYEVTAMPLPLRKTRVAAPPGCPLTECMKLLRGAWAPNVIWYLSGGARRFGELRHDIPRISARVLSARLRELEERGVIERRLIDSSPPSAEYGLTALGHELVPAIKAIVDVGTKLKHQAGARKRAPARSDSAARMTSAG